MNHKPMSAFTDTMPFLTACRTAFVTACLLFALGVFAAPGRAADLTVYTDSLQNGFQDWSWATHNLSNTSPVQSGSDSISVTFGSYTGLYLHGSSINTANYTALSFWVNGGTAGGQRFTVSVINGSGNAYPSVPVSNYISGGIPANQWVHVTIPLSDLHVASTTDFSGFWFQDSTGGAQPALYVDTISFLAQPPPSTVHVTVNASQSLQTVDSREFGVNTAIWDSNLGTATTDTLMNAAGAGVFRYPGGSASDGYDWTVLQYNGQSSTPIFGTLTDATGAKSIITANYGSGSPQMAAAWVAYCNATTSSTVAIGNDSAGRNWQNAGYWAALRGAMPLGTDDGLNFLRVGHAAPYGFKFWEIGNECYGSWENDTHSAKQDPVIYANVAQSMTALMKQVDPTIQTGVVVTSTEDDSGNQTETVTNPVTGVQHKGWTAVLFSTLNSINYVPDYVIYHNYAQAPGAENDSILLQYAPSWTGDATSIRTMLTQYMGTKATGSQLICTENNSVYTNPGKQSTSLVNGLYFADSMGSLMQTEFKGMVWWDLRNGEDTSQNNSSSLYGWRLYGDYGILGNAGAQPGGNQDTPYPTYFALKLASHFARGGDTIVPATSDYSVGLSAYAAKRAGGGLSLLVINKNPTTSLNTNIALTGYTPVGTATTYTYGETEDTRQSTGAMVDLTQSSLTGVASTFSTTASPYSMTVINLAPVLPVTTASLSGTSGTNGWYVSPVTVMLSATAGAAWTIAATYYTIDGGAVQTYTVPFAVSSDGSHTVSYWSVDSAGNTGVTNTTIFKVDATAPTVTFGAASPAANGNGWNSGTVTLPYTAADATSGVASASPGSPLTFSAQGANQTQTVTVTDNAGNVKAFTSPAINIDETAPVTTASTSGTTVTLSATDTLSGVAATTYTIDGGTSQTYTAPFTVTANATHTIIYGSVDKAGNAEATHTLTVTGDTAPPVTTASLSGTTGTNGWYTSSVSVTLAATDNLSGVASTYYTIDGGAAQTYSTPFTVLGDGTHTVTYWSVDNAGNVEATNTLTIKIDGTVPTLVFGAASPVANAAGWNSGTVTLPYTAADATSGVASATPGSPLTFSAQGASQTQTVTVTDNAGNVKTLTSPAVSIDTTAPVTTASANGTTVTLAATDNLSGVAATTYTIDGGAAQTYTAPFTVTANATHTITYSSVDVAGNTETLHTLMVAVDTAPPVTTASPSGTLGANGWYTSSVTVTLSATDNLSGVASTYYTVDGGAAQAYSTPFTVSGDGTHTVTYWSVDVAGNTEATNTLSIKIDGTAPTLVFGAASPAANGNGWNNGTVTLPYTASDATSGVASASPGSPLTFSAQGAGQTQTVTVTDNAGNVKTFTSPAVSIDTTAPVTTASASGATVTLSATDNLSGVAATTYTIDGGAQMTYTGPFTVTGVGTHTIVYGSVDKAGNVEATHTLTVTINAAPTLTSISPSSAVAGTGGFTLTATGTGYTNSSVIAWNGSALATTYVSATQLTATVPASLIASVGTASIAVVTPAPGGGTSSAKAFTINAPALTGLSLSPTSVVYGTSVTGTVALASAAPVGGIVVTLTSNSAAATVPASVTVSAGQTTVTFPVTTHAVTASTSVTITAKAGTVSKTAKLTVKPPTVPQSINCGGSAASPFVADSSYSGGSGSKTTHSITTTGVTNPAPTAVYQSQRTGTFTYTLANLVPNASYTLRLHFCEYNYATAGSRKFNVSANGSSLLTNFDIFAAAGGEYKANVQQFTVTADGTGKVTVQVTFGTAGTPALNGIQIQ